MNADGHVPLARAALLQLHQREIGLVLDPVQQRVVVGREFRDWSDFLFVPTVDVSVWVVI